MRRMDVYVGWRLFGASLLLGSGPDWIAWSSDVPPWEVPTWQASPVVIPPWVTAGRRPESA